jgi:hypothetical protein
MKKIIVLLFAFALVLSPASAAFFPRTVLAASTSYSGHPFITITKVERDTSVTFKATHLPPDDAFEVFIGRMGTRGVKGIDVDSFETGDGGTLTLTVDIPSEFQGDRQIAIRIESATESGYFAYNWFYNNSTGSGGTGGTSGGDGYGGYPTIRISKVVRNSSVTIRVMNLPAEDEFLVSMGRYGSRGVRGYRVDSFDTGDGGNQTLTFDIPSELKGLARIAIRIESKTGSGYFAYNWFYNNSSR